MAESVVENEVIEDDTLEGGETGNSSLLRPDQEEVEMFRRKANRVDNIPLSLIDVSDVALRGVQRQTEEFTNLVDSIRNRGVMNSIVVREHVNAAGVTRYQLIDGLQRFTASGDAGLLTIPANIVNVDDGEVLEIQLITNLNRVTTKPADQCKHLFRMLSRNPNLTKSMLAERVSQSLAWVDARLSLKNLHETLIADVNEGTINLSNAIALTKFPKELQLEHADDARKELPKSFVPRMKNLFKQIKEAKKTGQDAKTSEFEPAQFLQKASVIKAELENPEHCRALIADAGLPAESIAAAKLAIAWVLNFDPQSQAEQKRNHEVREAEKAAEKARIKERKEKEKAEQVARDQESISKW